MQIESGSWEDSWANKDLLHRVKTERRHEHPVSIQSYFVNTWNSSWVVNPDLEDRPSNDLYSLFLNDFVPKMKASQQIPVPTKDRDLHPWTKFCGFLEFLGKFASDNTKRAHLVDAATLPRQNDPKYGKLHKWTNNYMAKVRSLSKLARVQRQGLLLLGAMNTTPADTLDAHANLLPFHLLLDKVRHRATLRMATLPESNPVCKQLIRACRVHVRHHRASLHRLVAKYRDVKPERIETIVPCRRKPQLKYIVI